MGLKIMLMNMIISAVIGLFVKVMDSFGYLNYNFTNFNLLVLSMLCWLLLNQLGLPEGIEVKSNNKEGEK